MNKVERYGALDGLRAYAAIGILIMHASAIGNYAINGFMIEKVVPSWTLFVFLFMMVSAFSLCCGYYEKFQNNQIDYKEFYKKRFSRIWPLFAVLSLVDFVVAPSREALYEGIANLTLCFGFLPNHNISIVGVGWFLGVVFVFYMIFPFFCTLMSSRASAWGAFITACIFHVLCLVYFFDGGHVLSNFERMEHFSYGAVYFVAGGLLYLYRMELAAFSRRYRWIVLAACALSTVLMAMTGANSLVIMITFVLYIMYAIGNQGGFLENRFTKFISGISLEIYLSHMAIIRMLEKLHMIKLFGDNGWSLMFTSVVTFVAAVVFAVAFQKMLQWTAKQVTACRTQKMR